MQFIIAIALLLSGCQTSSTAKRDEAKVIASHKRIIVSYLNSGVPSQAHGELRKIMEQYPDDVDFLELMGLTQLALQNPGKAVSYLRKAYRQSGDAKVALNLSSALIAAGSLQQAQKLILTLLEEGTGTYRKIERLYHNLGLIAERRKRYAQAERYYRKALAENPSYYLTLLRLGLLCQQQRRYRDAVMWLHKAKNFCRKCLEPVEHLSRIYQRTGKPQQAFMVIDAFSRQIGLNQQERSKALALRQQLQKIAAAKTM